jgi:hypothetical protein
MGAAAGITLNIKPVNEAMVIANPAYQSMYLDSLISSGQIKSKTEYIKIGDEPPGQNVINLAKQMTIEQMESLKLALIMVPRLLLRPWFEVNLKAKLEAGTEEYVWAALIDIFNETNLGYVTVRHIEPWYWESQKLEAYYKSQDPAQKALLDEKYTQYLAAKELLNPQAMALMRAYATLPKLGDLGLEINRQNAVRELLKQKEFEAVKAIIDAYRYADNTGLGPLLTQPIKEDITTPEFSVKATPVNQ